MKPSYLDHLEPTAAEDVRGLLNAQRSYGDSWKKRGGVGAFMMLARKWDRIEKALEPSTATEKSTPDWDVFAAALADDRSEGIIDDIRDLRRYLLLVEAELRSMGATSALSEHRDSAK